MDGAKKLAYLLEGCGAKYTRTDATEGTLFTVSTSDEQYFVLVRDDGAGIEMWSRYFTPEQAIAATVGTGMLTAEQVREAIMSADRWKKPMGDTGMTNTHLIIRDDGWQAIADELNATVGAGTCRNISKVTDTSGRKVRFVCSECDAWIDSEFIWNHEYSNGESPWAKDCKLNYCPNCGRRIEGEE